MNIIRSMQPLLTSRVTSNNAALQIWRERIFTAITIVAVVSGLPVIIVTLINQYQRQNWVLIGIYSLAYLWVFAISIIRKLPYFVRAGSFVLLCYSIGFITTFDNATAGDGNVWFLVTSIIAAIFIGGRFGFGIAAVNLFSWLAIGFLFTRGIITFPQSTVDKLSQPDNYPNWINLGVTFSAASLTVIASASAVLNNLSATLLRSQDLTEELEQKSNELQTQTDILTQRTKDLENSTKIIGKISSILAPDRFIQESADLIRKEFNFSHVGIYIVDDATKFAKLEASTGFATIDFSPQLEIATRSDSAISHVVSTAEVYTFHEGDEKVFQQIENQLSTMRSYAVLPMREREQIIGAIALQSDFPKPFDLANLYTLQILVEQIATLYTNAQLFVERESALEAERRAYGELTQSAWKQIIQSRREIGFRRDKNGISPATETRSSQARNGNSLSIPIRVRGHLIGFVDAQKSNQSGPWKTSESDLLESIADRLESALDTARLYEDTQLLAEQERLVGEVTTKIRETLDTESVLRTAVHEIRAAMDIPKVSIRLLPESPEENE